MSTRGSGLRSYLPPTHQADAVLSQANPVSATLYTVLAATKNVRVISISINVTWAVTQPDPLDIVATVDGQTIIWPVTNPVSAIGYNAYVNASQGTATQSTNTDPLETSRKAFLLEGKSVKIEARVIWAVTQPTPLGCRVKYAKW